MLLKKFLAKYPQAQFLPVTARKLPVDGEGWQNSHHTFQELESYLRRGFKLAVIPKSVQKLALDYDGVFGKKKDEQTDDERRKIIDIARKMFDKEPLFSAKSLSGIGCHDYYQCNNETPLGLKEGRPKKSSLNVNIYGCKVDIIFGGYVVIPNEEYLQMLFDYMDNPPEDQDFSKHESTPKTTRQPKKDDKIISGAHGTIPYSTLESFQRLNNNNQTEWDEDKRHQTQYTLTKISYMRYGNTTEAEQILEVAKILRSDEKQCIKTMNDGIEDAKIWREARFYACREQARKISPACFPDEPYEINVATFAKDIAKQMDIVYNGEFFKYDGSFLWEPQEGIVDMTQKYFDALEIFYSTEIKDPDTGKRIRYFPHGAAKIAQCGLIPASQAFAKQLQAETRIKEKMDAVSDKIPFADGQVIEASTGEQCKDPKNLYITKPMPWAPVEGSTKNWDKFIKATLGEEEAEYFEKVLAIALLGGNPHQIFLYIEGATETGKSTIMKALRILFGDRHYQGPDHAFMRMRNSAPHISVKIRPPGTRIGVYGEQNAELGIWAVNEILERTGDDVIVTREMYGKYAEYEAAEIPIMFGNAIPKADLAGSSLAALCRRLRYLKTMPKSFSKRDPKLHHKFEYPQIMFRLMQRLKTYLLTEEEPEPPDSVKTNNNEYQHQTSHYVRFVDQCRRPAKEMRIRAAIREFKRFYYEDSNGETIRVNTTNFKKKLEEQGINFGTVSSGKSVECVVGTEFVFTPDEDIYNPFAEHAIIIGSDYVQLKQIGFAGESETRTIGVDRASALIQKHGTEKTVESREKALDLLQGMFPRSRK